MMFFKFYNLFNYQISKCTLLRLNVIIFIIFMAGCGKEEVAPKIDDKNELLLAGEESKTWLIVSSKKNGVEWLPECMEDDDWIFTRTGRFSRTSTSLSCTNGIRDKVISKWAFANKQKWLYFDNGTYEIVSLSEHEMVLYFPNPDGDSYLDTWIKK